MHPYYLFTYPLLLICKQICLLSLSILSFSLLNLIQTQLTMWHQNLSWWWTKVSYKTCSNEKGQTLKTNSLDIRFIPQISGIISSCWEIDMTAPCSEPLSVYNARLNSFAVMYLINSNMPSVVLLERRKSTANWAIIHYWFWSDMYSEMLQCGRGGMCVRIIEI